jgi:hypothetical protein
MKSLRSIFLSLLLLVSLEACCEAAAAGPKVYNDEDLRQIIREVPEFKQTHSVMMRQRKRLHDILDSFLGGNLDEVNRYAEDLSRDMSTIAMDYVPSDEKQVEAWKTMAAIINQAKGLEEDTRNGDYRAAEEHYYNIINHCMHCHQVVRDWGKLPEKQDGKSAPQAPQGQENTEKQAEENHA